MDKPMVALVGLNGNAFAVIGACKRAAKKAGWTDEKWKDVNEEMTSGDYNHLLHTVVKYFEVL